MRTRQDLVRLLETSGIAYETLVSGECWMIVAPSLAARIMGAGIGDENAFWVPPAISTRGWNDGGNAGGQRTWIAPEGGRSGFFFSADGTRWSVASGLDPGAYRASPGAAGWKKYAMTFTARSADGSSRKITIAREMKLEEEPGPGGIILRIRFRHTLGNAGSTILERRIGLWSLIQLPCGQEGILFFSLRGEGKALAPYFGQVPDLSMGDEGRVAWMRLKGGTRFKAGMPPSGFAGTIGFLRHARMPGARSSPLVLTSMSFDVDPAGTYVDKASHVVPGAPANGDAAQAYCDAGTGDLAFCEIEAHAPAPFLAPGDAEAQNVTILIASLEEEDIGTYMSEKLGMEPLPRTSLPA